MENIENNIFAEKLERLFKEKTKPDGTLYTPTDVLETTSGVLTRVHLWKLRNGQAANPSLKVIQALADFFGVHPSYFFENEDAVKPAENDQREELQVLLRSFGLDREGQKAILLMVEALKNQKK